MEIYFLSRFNVLQYLTPVQVRAKRLARMGQGSSPSPAPSPVTQAGISGTSAASDVVMGQAPPLSSSPSTPVKPVTSPSPSPAKTPVSPMQVDEVMILPSDINRASLTLFCVNRNSQRWPRHPSPWRCGRMMCCRGFSEFLLTTNWARDTFTFVSWPRN